MQLAFVLNMDNLTADQLLKDMVRIAEDISEEKNITDSKTIIFIMEGIRRGIVRGIEITKNVYKAPADPDDIPF